MTCKIASAKRHCLWYGCATARVGLRGMNQEPNVPQPDARLRFLRVLGTIWLVIMALTLGGAALAPYLGQIADIVLQQTVHRHWTRLTLDAEQPFFDLSTPTRAVQSYYSALYQGNVAQYGTTHPWCVARADAPAGGGHHDRASVHALPQLRAD